MVSHHLMPMHVEETPPWWVSFLRWLAFTIGVIAFVAGLGVAISAWVF